MKKRREEWIDQLRGLAVIGMIETHTANTFLSAELQASPAFEKLTYANGLVAPVFFWVLGYVRGPSELGSTHIRPAWPAVKRLLFILLIGYLMHAPWEWISPSTSTPNILWRVFLVDVLQCLAVSGLLLVAIEQTGRFSTIIAMLALCLLIPFSDMAQHWRTGFIPVDAYFTSQHGSLFPLFPWAGFALAGFVTRGVSGKIFRLIALGVFLGLAADSLPYLDSTSCFFLERLGWVILIAMSARLFFERWSPSINLGWLCLAGRESLIVYVAHLTLIHALPFPGGTLERQFGATQSPWITGLLFMALLAVSLGLATWKQRLIIVHKSS